MCFRSKQSTFQFDDDGAHKHEHSVQFQQNLEPNQFPLINVLAPIPNPASEAIKNSTPIPKGSPQEIEDQEIVNRTLITTPRAHFQIGQNGGGYM